MRALAFMATLMMFSNMAFSGSVKNAPPKEALLLVFPVFGDCPPELTIPWAGLLAESLLLILPQGNLNVVAQEPTEPIFPGSIEPIARQKGHEMGANAVVWGELIPPGNCPSARIIRLRILDLETQELFKREICPSQASAEDIARVLALSVANALKDGAVNSITIPRSKNRIIRKKRKDSNIGRKIRCPDVAPCKCPERRIPCKHEDTGQFGVLAGGYFSSHPNWSSPGLGMQIGLEWRLAAWSSIGLTLMAIRGRRVEVGDVNALYTSWPVSMYWNIFWKNGLFGWGLKLGGELAWSRLDVLIERLDSVRTVEELNPVLFARATIAIKLGEMVWLEFDLGPSAFLRKQKYTYITPEGSETVLQMQTISVEAGLTLLVEIF